MAMDLSMKVALVSGTVLCMAVMFNLLLPLFMDFAISDLPVIWTSLISWLEPPYLYVVINCIIITIVASSRLQSKVDDSPSPPIVATEIVKVAVALPADVQQIHEASLPYDGVMLINEQVEELKPVQFVDAGYTSAEFVQVSEPDLSAPEFDGDARDADTKTVTEAYEEIMKNSVNKSVSSISSWNPPEKSQIDLSLTMGKPPATARFSHRKPVKSSPEGGRALKVSKPKRQDTLETTWKTITEGRSMPLTRHLRKSDTWETHGQGRHHRNREELTDHNPDQRMTKSDTFSVNQSGRSRKPPPASTLSRADGSGKLRKEPSVGQEELNRRVEAFIKKFNEDMRIQRQESLNQYMEMINRGAH